MTRFKPQGFFSSIFSSILLISACDSSQNPVTQASIQPPEIGSAIPAITETPSQNVPIGSAIPAITETPSQNVPDSLRDVTIAMGTVRLDGTNIQSKPLQGFESAELPLIAYVNSLPPDETVSYQWQQIDEGLPLVAISIPEPGSALLDFPVVPNRTDIFRFALTITTGSGEQRTMFFEPNVAGVVSCPRCSIEEADRMSQLQRYGIEDALDFVMVDDELAYYSSRDNSIVLFNTVDQTVHTRFTFDENALQLALNQQSQKLYALTSSYIVEIDTLAGESKQIDVVGEPQDIFTDTAGGLLIISTIDIDDNPIWLPSGGASIRYHERSGIFYYDPNGVLHDLTYDDSIQLGQAVSNFGQHNWFYDGHSASLFYIDASLIRRFKLTDSGRLVVDYERQLTTDPITDPANGGDIRLEHVDYVSSSANYLFIAGGIGYYGDSPTADQKIVALNLENPDETYSVLSINPTLNAHAVNKVTGITTTDSPTVIAYSIDQIALTPVTFRVADLLSGENFLEIFHSECGSKRGEKLSFTADNSRLTGFTPCGNQLYGGPIVTVVDLPAFVR